MKKLISLFGILACLAVPAFAEDATPAVAERKSCAELKAEMDNLALIEEPDESQTAALENVRQLYRRTCIKSAAGRRTSSAGRAASVAPAQSANDAATTGSASAIDEFLAKKKENCKSLEDEITNLSDKQDDDSVQMLATLKKQFDADCTEKPEAEEISDVIPETTPEEQVAQIAANIEAGLCADGSTPNKYGCCAGEKFTDMGDLVFACCPDDGSECFPPIN